MRSKDRNTAASPKLSSGGWEVENEVHGEMDKSRRDGMLVERSSANVTKAPFRGLGVERVAMRHTFPDCFTAFARTVFFAVAVKNSAMTAKSSAVTARHEAARRLLLDCFTAFARTVFFAAPICVKRIFESSFIESIEINLQTNKYEQ
jgi:hypothetical protein